MKIPTFLRLAAALIPLFYTSCASMNALKKGDIIGGVISAPFELTNGALETAMLPLSGKKPEWVRDAQIARMKTSNPQINDPAWRAKFDKELRAGDIIMPTFTENLEAYRLTSNERYLSRAEQLTTSDSQRSAIEEQVLRKLGGKAFDVDLQINGQSTSSRYSERESKVLFISGNVYGAKVHPTGRATVRLRSDLPFKIKDRYVVTVNFKFVIPRESTMFSMGMKQVSDRNSVSVVTRDFTISADNTSATTSLDFGSLNGAGTVAVLGSQSAIKVTGRPYTSFEVTNVARQ